MFTEKSWLEKTITKKIKQLKSKLACDLESPEAI